MHALLPVVLAFSLQAPEQIFDLKVELPPGWVRHDAGGVVRVAPRELAQPEGVTFFPADRDPDPDGWAMAFARQLGLVVPKPLKCPYPVSLCWAAVVNESSGALSNAVFVAWAAPAQPAPPGVRASRRVQGALVRLHRGAPQPLEAQVQALLKSAALTEPGVPQTTGWELGAVLGAGQLPGGLVGHWRDPQRDWRLFLSGQYERVDPRTRDVELGRWSFEDDALIVVPAAPKDGGRARQRYHVALGVNGFTATDVEDPANVLRPFEPAGQLPLNTWRFEEARRAGAQPR